MRKLETFRAGINEGHSFVTKTKTVPDYFQEFTMEFQADYINSTFVFTIRQTHDLRGTSIHENTGDFKLRNRETDLLAPRMKTSNGKKHFRSVDQRLGMS